MSGRARVTLSDGRRVTGFRKTLKQRCRVPPHLLPDWEASLELPGVLGIGGPVTIRGKRKDWVLEQLAGALRAKAPDGLPNPIEVRLSRSAVDGPVPYKAEDRVHFIEFDGRELRLISGASMRLIA